MTGGYSTLFLQVVAKTRHKKTRSSQISVVADKKSSDPVNLSFPKKRNFVTTNLINLATVYKFTTGCIRLQEENYIYKSAGTSG